LHGFVPLARIIKSARLFKSKRTEYFISADMSLEVKKSKFLHADITIVWFATDAYLKVIYCWKGIGST